MIRRKPTKGFDPVFTMGLVTAGMWVFIPILFLQEMRKSQKDRESLKNG